MRLLIIVILSIFIISSLYWQFFKKAFPIFDQSSLTEKFFKFIIKKVKKRNKRILALKTAEKYIQPYENIFSNLKLVNKFCIVQIDTKNNLIKLRSKKYNQKGEKLSATAYNFTLLDENDCFNHLCTFFGYKTTFEECLEIVQEYAKIRTEVIEKQEIEEPKFIEEPKEIIKPIEEIPVNIDISNKVDINNSSESELIGLPGINIILAKKIIKFREEERQFYSVQDFLRTMKIKPHFAKQLEDLIIVRKINIQKVKKAKKERIIDI